MKKQSDVIAMQEEGDDDVYVDLETSSSVKHLKSVFCSHYTGGRIDISIL